MIIVGSGCRILEVAWMGRAMAYIPMVRPIHKCLDLLESLLTAVTTMSWVLDVPEGSKGA